MEKQNKDKHFIKKPFYEGGQKALGQYIKEHLKYPKEALEAKLEGYVIVRYTINAKGKVIQAKVISPLGKGCDEEAVRLVKSLKFQVRKNRNDKILFHRTIRINFKLPAAKPQQKHKPKPNNDNISVQITYQPTKSSDTPDKGKSNGGYTYQINLPS